MHTDLPRTSPYFAARLRALMVPLSELLFTSHLTPREEEKEKKKREEKKRALSIMDRCGSPVNFSEAHVSGGRQPPAAGTAGGAQAHQN
jgi:hypothetical protein